MWSLIVHPALEAEILLLPALVREELYAQAAFLKLFG
jgi:hypothetical protein